MRWLRALALLWPGLGAAQDFPAFYEVTGLGREDVLDVHVAPDAGSEILTTFGPFQDEIEVAGAEGSWLLVPLGERSGWVQAQHMHRTGPDWQNGMPRRYGCFGTEPNWYLHVNEGVALWSTPEAPRRRFETVETITSEFHHITRHAAADDQMTIFASHGFCSDGMSDAIYGLRATVLWSQSNQAFNGCCSIAP